VPYLTGVTIDRAIVPHDTSLLLGLVIALVALAAVQAFAAGTKGAGPSPRGGIELRRTGRNTQRPVGDRA
jgi:hypothetical protein